MLCMITLDEAGRPRVVTIKKSSGTSEKSAIPYIGKKKIRICLQVSFVLKVTFMTRYKKSGVKGIMQHSVGDWRQRTDMCSHKVKTFLTGFITLAGML